MELATPRGYHPEALRGSEGWHSIRVNDQWRLVFRWAEQGPTDVSIVRSLDRTTARGRLPLRGKHLTRLRHRRVDRQELAGGGIEPNEIPCGGDGNERTGFF